MKVGKGRVVGLDYRLHLGDGQVIDESLEGDPLSYLHGTGQIVPGLEGALEGMAVGESKQVTVPPKEGYGEHDPRGVQEVPLSQFPPGAELEAGSQFVAQNVDGEPMPLTIREVRASTAVVDLNHPLAGKTLHFDVKVVALRDATPEELEHGHAHGPEGDEAH